MRQLILMRHGQAEPSAASGRDVDRTLTASGRGDAAQAGAALAAAGARPDRVLVSAARRTQETWAAVAPTLENAPEVEVSAELYDADAETLLQAASACGAEAVMVVAHNPGVAELAARLSGATAAFPPAALAVFAWEGDAVRTVLRRDPG